MADVIGPDFYIANAPAEDVEPPSSDLIDTNDPAFGHIMRACLQLTADFGFDLADPDIVRGAIRAGRRRHQRQAEEEREAKAQVEATGEVVYYMRIGNRVKIGFSASLTLRLATINPEELMATEPGGWALEQHRHRQFRKLRTNGEWFKLAEPLTTHIVGLQESQDTDSDLPSCLTTGEPRR